VGTRLDARSGSKEGIERATYNPADWPVESPLSWGFLGGGAQISNGTGGQARQTGGGLEALLQALPLWFAQTCERHRKGWTSIIPNAMDTKMWGLMLKVPQYPTMLSN